LKTEPIEFHGGTVHIHRVSRIKPEVSDRAQALKFKGETL